MSDVSARPVLAAHRRRHAVLFAAALVALSRLPRDRRFWEHAIALAIGLAAATALARESQGRSLARLAAWLQEQDLREQRAANKKSGA